MILEPIIPISIVVAGIAFAVAVVDSVMIQEGWMPKNYKHFKFWTLALVTPIISILLHNTLVQGITLSFYIAFLYWIVFERFLNYFMGWHKWHVGTTSTFDNLLRSMWGEQAGYYAYLTKLFLTFTLALTYTYLNYQ